MAKVYDKIDIQFEVQQIGIDTFNIPSDEIAKRGYQYLAPIYEVTEEGMEDLAFQNVGDYLSKEVLKEVASIREEATIVLDIQVGKGKTQACYDLISDYCQEADKVVLMVSPFKKLVEKDYAALIGRNLSAFNYMQLSNDDTYADVLEQALNSKVHVMTVDCLLGNPGEDAFAQSFVKRNYLSTLHAKCRKEGKKVIIFFDEIHEAIDNFAPQLFPNLLQWADVVYKCFVSSATYTIAVYPVLKYIGLLTNKTIVEFHVRRHKWRAENISKLHLHIIAEEYSGGNLAPLEVLKTLLKDNVGRQVNILSAHKSVIKALLNPKDSYGQDNPFYEVVAPYDFNEVHGDTNNAFDEKGNNIGTTFKTGVNVDNPDSVLIVILPVVKQNAPESIFSDGVPSIVQALARQRKGGNIHILMYDPAYLIEPDPNSEHWVDGFGFKGYRFFETYKPLRERLDSQLIAGKKEKHHIDQHRAFNILRKEYNERYDKNAAIIELMSKSEADGTIQTGFQYPTFEQYLTDEGTRLLVKNYPQFGGDLSSYVLWAAMNSQFVNAELASITYHKEAVVEVRFDGSDFKKSLLSHLKPELIEGLKMANLKRTRFLITEAISQPKDSEATYQYRIDDNVLPFNYLVTDYRFLRSVLEIAAGNIGIPTMSDELKAQYILHTMADCVLRSDATKPIEQAYKKLYEVQVDFIDYCNSVMQKSSSGYGIHKNADVDMSMVIAETVKDIAATLQAKDPFIKSKGISFLQNIDKAVGAKLRAKVFNELCKVFTNISDVRVTIGKEKKAYYKIDGQLDKPLPNSPMLNGI